MTPEQKAAIAAKLGADLAPLDNDRLIELCLLHRAQPKALESFPNALTAEINRRFTAAEIARDDVPYSILQHFANQFTGVVPYFHRLMQDMAATVNRDIWFRDNAEAFKTALDNTDAAAWLAGQADILDKCLGNRLALGYIAQSTVAATAILTRAEALAQWKNAPALWDIWPQHAAGMQVLVKSDELIDYLFSTPAAVAGVQKQLVAIRILAGNAKAMTHMITPAFMKTVITDEGVRNAFIAGNSIFQGGREALYKAISASGSGWERKYGSGQDGVGNHNSQVASPAGCVFACLGYYSGQGQTTSTMIHPGGTEAARAGTTYQPSAMTSVDGVSFNGATFTEQGDGYAYVELWAPQG